MKKYLVAGAIFSVLIFAAYPVFSEKSSIKILPSVSEGKYTETDAITFSKLAYMPIPSAKEDYAFLQSIGRECHVVLGQFKSGDRKIILITDKNNDGTVDEVSTYMVDSKKMIRSKTPTQMYSAEVFKKMKLDIIEGNRGELSPNAEGSVFAKKMIDSGSNIVRKIKYKNGYKVFIDDPDSPNSHRAMFYFSNNESVGGADLAFEVVYYNFGSQMVSSVIRFSVYCKDSTDKTIIDAVKDLSAYTAQRMKGVGSK
jgi:hypothetical protein